MVKLCEQKLKYGAVPLFALPTIPLAYMSVNLTGGGHTPIGGYLPFLLLYGPLALLIQVFNPDLMPEVMGHLFVFGSPFALYLVYGFVLAFLSARNTSYCRRFVISLFVLHGISGIAFLYLGGFLGE